MPENLSSPHPVDDLRPVSIQELAGLAEGCCWDLDQHLAGLDSLTPVRGHVHALHRGNLLEVEGEAATILTRCCDRCLQHFNQPLSFRIRDLIWLGEAARDGEPETWQIEAGEAVLDLDPDALSESIDPAGSFDPAHWTFEQLSLRIPAVSCCGAACPGPASWGTGDPGGDPRWATLARLVEPPPSP